jgi:hypothetical protein
MTPPVADLDRAKAAATRAVAKWLVTNGYGPLTLGAEALQKGYPPELADWLARIVLEVADGARRVTINATWPYAKHGQRPPMEDGR